MKSLYYIRYFFFIAKNWNIRLAWFTLVHEIRGEKKYRINTVRLDNLQHQKIESLNLQHASIYQGTPYHLLEKAFDYLKSEEAIDSIIDWGSGRGRVLVVAAYYGFRKITGIDFSYSLCAEAEANMEQVSALFPGISYSIRCEDAAQATIAGDANVFFFFNPFDEKVMIAVVKNLLFSLKQYPRKIFIVYVNPLHNEVFLSAGFREVYFYQKMEYVNLSILSMDPALSE